MKASILAFICIALLSACWQRRTACVYEVPEGFSGWVLIEFERPEAPPIPKKDGKLIFRIGSDGRLATSSSPEFGVATDEYYFVGATRTKIPFTGWGGGGLVWGGSNGSTESGGKTLHVFQNLFVGTEAAFKSSAANRLEPK